MITIHDLLEIYVHDQGNITGGYLHVVLDDMNTETNHVEFCYKECLIANEIVGLKIAEILLKCSEQERINICKQFQTIAGYPNAGEDR